MKSLVLREKRNLKRQEKENTDNVFKPLVRTKGFFEVRKQRCMHIQKSIENKLD